MFGATKEYIDCFYFSALEVKVFGVLNGYPIYPTLIPDKRFVSPLHNGHELIRIYVFDGIPACLFVCVYINVIVIGTGKGKVVYKQTLDRVPISILPGSENLSDECFVWHGS